MLSHAVSCALLVMGSPSRGGCSRPSLGASDLYFLVRTGTSTNAPYPQCLRPLHPAAGLAFSPPVAGPAMFEFVHL